LSTLITGALPAEVEVPAPAAPPPTESTAHSGEKPAGTAGPIQIPLAEISANPHQPRKAFSDDSLQQLATSLRSTGMIQPVIVRKVERGYQLIAGERRLRAAKLAGLDAVPAIVRDVDGLTQAQMGLIENTQREDLNAIDRAMAYQALLQQLGLTQAELAQRIGDDRSTIANHLRLLELPNSVREAVAAGGVSLGHAKVLAGLSDPAIQEKLAAKVAAEGLSVRALERLITEGGEPKTSTPKPAGSPHFQQMETSISRQLGMKVQVKAANGKPKGKMVIHYASLDQFDDLLAKLGVKLEE
jgi:ParB family chromosome partitioning protein